MYSVDKIIGTGGHTMDVVVFGKVQCGKCKGTQSRVTFLVEKLGLSTTVPIRFVDVETIDGRAEGAFHDVYDLVPVTIIMDDGRELGRWEGEMPRSEELTPLLENSASASPS
jgi:hypothetical protein